MLAVGHECDLALLSVAEEDFWVMCMYICVCNAYTYTYVYAYVLSVAAEDLWVIYL